MVFGWGEGFGDFSKSERKVKILILNLNKGALLCVKVPICVDFGMGAFL